MEKLPARAGLDWLKQGFGLFKQQPGPLFSVFFGYALFMLGIGILPVVGQIVAFLLTPVFAQSFMQASCDISHGKLVHPRLLLIGFRKPAFGTLCKFGLLYMVAMMLAIGAAALIDNGAFWQLLSGQLDQTKLDPQAQAALVEQLSAPMLLAGAIYMTISVLLCFGAPLIYWKKMSLGKAIFYSVFGVLGATKPFLLFLLSWFGVIVLSTQIVGLIFGNSMATVLLLMPLGFTFYLIVQCAFFASYRQIFGAPEPDAPPKDALL